MSRITVAGVVLVAMLFTLGTATAQEGLEGSCWYDRICIIGYAHARYTFAEMGAEGFDLTRLFLTVKADPTENATVIFTLNRGGDSPSQTNIEIYNAFVDWKINDQWALQVGQVPTWFGYSGWRGSSERIEWERSRIIQGIPFGSPISPDGRTGFFVLGAPDRGVWLRRNPSGSEPLFIVGVSNGQFRSADANSSKNVDAHIKFQRPWGSFGASWLKGTFTPVAPFPAGPEADRDALGLYLVYNPNPWGFQGEWASGEMFNRDRDGFHLQGMYNTGSGIAYASWEEFDVDPGGGIPFADSYEAWSFGYAWDLDAANRVTLQYTDAEWTSGPLVADESYGGVQWQFAYR